MRKRLAIPLAALAAAGLAGGAFAASQSNSNPQQAFINDFARRLHVTPKQLTQAFKQALIDRVRVAEAAGKLSHAQAQAIEKRIELSTGLPFGPGPVACGPGGMSIHAFGPPGVEIPPFGPPAMLTAAARFLHISQQELRKELNSGKTLAQVAKAHGKSVPALVNALVTEARSQLNRSVKAGQLPRRFGLKLLGALTGQVHRIMGAHWQFAGTHGGFSISVRATGRPPFLALVAPAKGGGPRQVFVAPAKGGLRPRAVVAPGPPGAVVAPGPPCVGGWAGMMPPPFQVRAAGRG